MVFDTVRLGHSTDGRRIFVHYPRRNPDGTLGRNADGTLLYGAGFDIGEIPAVYWLEPPNAITAERVALWRELLG